MSKTRETIVMFPFMAQGHIIPFLALAAKLEERKIYNIIFVSTPLNVKKLEQSLPSNSSITFLPIAFNTSNHGLPHANESTDSLPSHLLLNFLEASFTLKPPFRELISDLVKEQDGHPPLCIITDILFGWCADIAHEFGSFHALFCSGSGFGIACYYSLWLNLPHLNSKSFTLPDFPEASTLHVTQMSERLRVADGTDRFSLLNQKLLHEWENSDGVLFNTVEEIYKAGLMYFRQKLDRPVWPIGPILLSKRSQDAAAETTSQLCKEWLDSKPVMSVLYICFGSQNTISASQMMELALALETSGRNFIWVVRPPSGFDLNMEFNAKEWLPEGFEERITVSKVGLLIKQWAPQVEILSHKSVSAFLSHCGWNSVLESLIHGVPLLGWPISAEQFYNAKMMEEKIGVLVEVGRGKGCEVRKEEMMKKIEMVMDETEKGKEMRQKVSEVKDVIMGAAKYEKDAKGSSVKAMDEFLNAALMMQKETKDRH